MSRVVTVVLAAGRGERLGGPKALLLWPAERPLAVEHVLAREESARVYCVVREEVARALAPIWPARGELVVSREPDALGPAGSLRAVAPAIAADAAVLVTPVDCPPVSTAVTAALLGALAGDVLATRPTHRGRRGHPVAIAASVLAGYRREALPLREVLAALGERVRDVEVGDPGVLADLDQPGDLGGSPTFFASG